MASIDARGIVGWRSARALTRRTYHPARRGRLLLPSISIQLGGEASLGNQARLESDAGSQCPATDKAHSARAKQVREQRAHAAGFLSTFNHFGPDSTEKCVARFVQVLRLRMFRELQYICTNYMMCSIHSSHVCFVSVLTELLYNCTCTRQRAQSPNVGAFFSITLTFVSWARVADVYERPEKFVQTYHIVTHSRLA